MMAYSTKAEFRANGTKFTITAFPDVIVDDRISQADLRVNIALSGFWTPSSFTEVPYAVNLLSQYKTAELCLRWKHSQNRDDVEISDITEYEAMFNQLVDDLRASRVTLQFSTGTYSKPAGLQLFGAISEQPFFDVNQGELRDMDL